MFTHVSCITHAEYPPYDTYQPCSYADIEHIHTTRLLIHWTCQHHPHPPTSDRHHDVHKPPVTPLNTPPSAPPNAGIRLASIRLASDWHPSVIQVSSYCHQSCIGSALDWRQVGIRLASDGHLMGHPIRTCIDWASDSHPTGIRLASDWHLPLAGHTKACGTASSQPP